MSRVIDGGLSEWSRSVLSPLREDLVVRSDPRVLWRVWWAGGVAKLWATPLRDAGRAWAIVGCGWEWLEVMVSPPPWAGGSFVSRRWELCDPGCFEELEGVLVGVGLLVSAERGVWSMEFVEGSYFLRVLSWCVVSRRGRWEWELVCGLPWEGLDEPGVDVVGVGPARGVLGVKEHPVFDVFWAGGWWRSFGYPVEFCLDEDFPGEVSLFLFDRCRLGLGPPSFDGGCDKSNPGARRDAPK